MDIPISLRSAIESGNCVLFVGAGSGAYFLDERGNPAPTSGELSDALGAEFGIDIPDAGISLSKISQVVEIRNTRKVLDAFVKSMFMDRSPSDVLDWIPRQRWRSIFTTNYDDAIEQAYKQCASPVQNPLTISLSNEIRDVIPGVDVPVYHIHGYLFSESDPKLILTDDDYAKFRDGRNMIFEILKYRFATSPILYIGYSNQDPNWNMLLHEVISEVAPNAKNKSFRIDPYVDLLTEEILEAKGIESLKCGFDEFVTKAKVILNQPIDIRTINQFDYKLPDGIHYDQNPTGFIRLFNSWELVNCAAFEGKSNIDDFLKGDRANWSLIAENNVFSRDIEDDVYEDALDYLTTKVTAYPTPRIILGPAAYGTSTLLMSIAFRLVSDSAAYVFRVKKSGELLLGDIEFALSIFTDKELIFIIDDISDHASEYLRIQQRLKETKQPVYFLFGDRLNEWRQCRAKIRVKEFELKELSDPEINRLLTFLELNNALNHLTNLSPELRFNAIKKRNKQQLLVAMREATEGKGFDAIIESEYHSIASSMAKRAYLLTSFFYQFGVYLRPELLARFLKCSVVELYRQTKDATDGIIIYDSVNESEGVFLARTRHRIIAEIVWERCSLSEEQSELIQCALRSLNLNYRYDVHAFEQFTRNDRIIVQLRTLENKISFFDAACRKDPDSPYIKQHYARMFAREEKWELALDQIDKAIELDKSVRVLYHTRGRILAQMAISIESIDLARRRFLQSETAFRKTISFDKRDDYGYQSLAELYLKWATRVDTVEEKTSYVLKAEEVISEGMQVARKKESLHIQASKIQRFIGNNPQRVEELEKAVKASPNSIISRYLLASAYFHNKREQEAKDVLELTIQNESHAFRSFILYAKCLLKLDEPLANSIAILRQSTLYGLSDPEFISLLGGLHFLHKEIGHAEEVFNEHHKHFFSAKERNSAKFFPAKFGLKQAYMTGVVRSVQNGYSILDSKEFSRIVCPASKYNGLVISEGMKLAFQLVFSAKGPLAIEPYLET